jgi:hypothetical protein
MVVSEIKQNISTVIGDRNILRKTFFGFLMITISFTGLTFFIYQGYLMKILRETKNESYNSLPEWDDWFQMIKDGAIFGFTVFLVQIPVQLFVIVPALAGLSEFIVLISALLGFVFSLFASYILMAYMTIIARDGLGEISNIGRVIGICKSRSYIKMTIVIFILGILFSLILTLIFSVISLIFLIILFIVGGSAIQSGQSALALVSILAGYLGISIVLGIVQYCISTLYAVVFGYIVANVIGNSITKIENN